MCWPRSAQRCDRARTCLGSGEVRGNLHWGPWGPSGQPGVGTFLGGGGKGGWPPGDAGPHKLELRGHVTNSFAALRVDCV